MAEPEFEDESYVMTEQQIARAVRLVRKQFMRDPEHRRRFFSGSTAGESDEDCRVLAPAEIITDPDRAEQLGLTADARRMRREQSR